MTRIRTINALERLRKLPDVKSHCGDVHPVKGECVLSCGHSGYHMSMQGKQWRRPRERRT